MAPPLDDLALIRAELKRVLQDNDGILDDDTEDIDPEITAALEEHSNNFPRKTLKDFAGDGSTSTFNLSDDAAEWTDEFSVIKTVELPTGEEPPSFLRDLDFTVFQGDPDEDGNLEETLQILSTTPSATEKVRLVHTALHTIKDLLSATATTLDVNHRYAFTFLAAAYCAEAIARNLQRKSDASVGEDVLSFGTQSDQWDTRAEVLRKKYENGVRKESAAGTSIQIGFEKATGSEPLTSVISKKFGY